MAPVTEGAVRYAVAGCVVAYFVAAGVLELYAKYVEGGLMA